MKRIIEIYESIPTYDNFVDVKTVEDATFIDHINICEKEECRSVHLCVDSDKVFGWYRVCKDGYFLFEKQSKISGSQKVIDSAKK